MSLLGLGIAAAGIYGLAMAWTEMDTETAKRRLHRIEENEGHVDVVKHFKTIVGMLKIKPRDGVLPADGYKECQDLLMLELMYVTQNDLKRFEQHYKKVRKEQLKEAKEMKNEEYKEVERFVKERKAAASRCGCHGKVRFDRINSYENVEDTVKRCNKLYRETPWSKIAKGPAKVIKTPDGKSKEMWMVKELIYADDRKIYKKCNKLIGYNAY